VNDEPNKLHEMLDRATAPTDQNPSGLDPETASLREVWLALGNLLEANSANSPNVVPSVSPSTFSVPTHRWRIHGWLALAATILILAGLAALYFRPVANEPVGKDLPVAVHPDDEAETYSNQLAWNDSLDDEINAIGEATLATRGDWYAQEVELNSVEKRLQQMEQDLGESTW
jgi:hypothetical protein